MKYKSKMWKETPEKNDEFVAKAMYCHGYDVANQIVPNADYLDYIFLMFTGYRPDKKQKLLFNRLAISLANPGLKTEAVRTAAMGAAVGCSQANNLIASMGVNSGLFGGSQEIYLIMSQLVKSTISEFLEWLHDPNSTYVDDVWQKFEHVPGFNPNSNITSSYVMDILSSISGLGKWSSFLYENRFGVQNKYDSGITMSLVAAMAFTDLELSPDKGAYLYLMLTLPGAAAHAAESTELGFKSFPFFGKAIKLDPKYDTENKDKTLGNSTYYFEVS